MAETAVPTWHCNLTDDAYKVLLRRNLLSLGDYVIDCEEPVQETTAVKIYPVYWDNLHVCVESGQGQCIRLTLAQAITLGGKLHKMCDDIVDTIKETKETVGIE